MQMYLEQKNSKRLQQKRSNPTGLVRSSTWHSSIVLGHKCSRREVMGKRSIRVGFVKKQNKLAGFICTSSSRGKQHLLLGTKGKFLTQFNSIRLGFADILLNCLLISSGCANTENVFCCLISRGDWL